MDNLETLGLHALRKYAREIGVKAPTALKKPELIKEIKRVEEGKVEPYYSKRGRPSYDDIEIEGTKRIDAKEKELDERITKLKTLVEEFVKNLKSI